MKRKTLLTLSLASVLTLWAGISLSQPPLNAQLRPELRPLSLSKLFQAGKLGELRLTQPDRFSTLTDLDGKLFAAAPRTVAALGDQGQVLRRFAVGIDRLSISGHAKNQLLLGDGARKVLSSLDTESGKVTELLRLDAVSDPNASQEPESALLKTGELSAVASNGKEAFVAMEAGFSSAIFKIDLATKRIVSRGWAPGAEMSAMAFFQDGLYVLTGNGSQVARYTNQVEKTLDKIELPTDGVKGLALRAGELHVLTDNVSRISKYQVDRTVTDASKVRLNVDIVRKVDILIPKIDWSKFLVKRYAVLICGDLAENFAGECFWNDTVWMYKTLLNNGYKPENIFVLYGDGMDYASRAIFMQQCRSGGFIDNLQNSKTFIATACRFDENARPADTENETVGGKLYNHGEFNYHITTALDRLRPTGGVINADTNSDGKISAREMSEWNRTHENLPENPVMNDGGPGNSFLFTK
ncbi:YncE family protein [Armatimonas sp.]|uniref:YncE family protein n=1 Tax=Armatimonas sp. TaxID=1872638 RepID=UPI0037537A06